MRGHSLTYGSACPLRPHASSSFVLKVYQSPFLKEKKGAHSKVQHDFLKTFTNFNLTFKHFQIPSINF